MVILEGIFKYRVLRNALGFLQWSAFLTARLHGPELLLRQSIGLLQFAGPVLPAPFEFAIVA